MVAVSYCSGSTSWLPFCASGTQQRQHNSGAVRETALVDSEFLLLGFAAEGFGILVQIELIVHVAAEELCNSVV